MSFRRTYLLGAGALLGFSLLSACTPTEEAGATLESGLGTVSIPAGFDFATTRAVTVQVAREDIAVMEVLTADAELLYRGPSRSSLGVSLPTAADHLQFNLTLLDGTVEQVDVQLQAGVARL